MPNDDKFQAKIRIEMPPGEGAVNGAIDVPGGGVVIQYASAMGMAPSGQTFIFELGTLLSGHLSYDKNHYLPVLQREDDGAYSTSIAGQVVRIYGNSTQIFVRATRSGTAGTGTVFVTVSGQLVGAP